LRLRRAAVRQPADSRNQGSDMAEDQGAEMDYKAHTGTYSSFTGLVKWTMVAVALTVALVLILIT
jgi:hypothetical protein